MYSIKIKNLCASTVLGVYAWEKESPRKIILNIAISVADDKAGKSDDIRDAVDYALVEQKILTALAQKSYNLIECMVTEIAQLIFSLNSSIIAVTVEADKPGALRQADSVAIIQEFSRESYQAFK